MYCKCVGLMSKTVTVYLYIIHTLATLIYKMCDNKIKIISLNLNKYFIILQLN